MTFPNDQPKVVNERSAPGWRIRQRGEEIRAFVLENIEKLPHDIAGVTATRFKVTRQAVNKHLQKLATEKSLVPVGKTRGRVYRLAAQSEAQLLYPITPDLAEDWVWQRDVAPKLGPLPENVMDIWHFCFTEMFNNAVDHSGGETIFVNVAKTAANTQVSLRDNGIGIFKKIQSALGLLDERHAILELAKGKLTTDPAKHTGQGIFFTSRLVESFDILAGGVYFGHTFGAQEDWILERPEYMAGTTIFMKLNNHTARTCKKIFDEYSSGDDYGFTKTVVPVKLAQYGQDKLISRSQAKRMLARVDLFKTVLFDFSGVETIGQAFADEIFRVFANAHPHVEVIPVHANGEVQQMIHSVRSLLISEVGGI